jgi:hypothetical protein
MARPVELCTKSVRRSTGLGSGAGVVVLRSFLVTLSKHSRRSGPVGGPTTRSGETLETLPPVWAWEQVDHGLRRPAGALTHPLFRAAFYRADRQPRRGSPASTPRRQSQSEARQRGAARRPALDEDGLLALPGQGGGGVAVEAGPPKLGRRTSAAEAGPAPGGTFDYAPRPGGPGVRLRPPQAPRPWPRPRARRSRPQQEPDRDPRSGRRDARARLTGAPCQASPRPVRDPPA